MANTRAKNFRMDKDFLAMLKGVSAYSKTSETEILQVAGALYAMKIGIEIVKARQFLFDNLLSIAATANVHKPHPQESVRPRRRSANTPPVKKP